MIVESLENKIKQKKKKWVIPHFHFPPSHVEGFLFTWHVSSTFTVLIRNSVLNSVLKGRDITLPTKARLVKAMVFPLVMFRCESWTCWRINAFELWCWRRLLKSPLECTEIKPVHIKGNQSWIFTGRTEAEAEAPILWSRDVKNQLIRKDPDAGKDWKWEEKGMTEDEMVGWHHRLNGHGFE